MAQKIRPLMHLLLFFCYAVEIKIPPIKPPLHTQCSDVEESPGALVGVGVNGTFFLHHTLLNKSMIFIEL